MLDELKFCRDDILGLVYASRRKAYNLPTDYSVDQIEAIEKHLRECWKMMDMLQDLIESSSIADIEKYMELKKQIAENAYDKEENTLIQKRLEHIVSLMERKVEELSANQYDVEGLTRQLEEQVGNARYVSKDFMIPLTGGEHLYSMFISNNDENTQFD